MILGHTRCTQYHSLKILLGRSCSPFVTSMVLLKPATHVTKQSVKLVKNGVVWQKQMGNEINPE